MKVSQRIYNWFTGGPSRKRVKRTYAASNRNRLNSGWTTVPTTSNYEIRQSLFALRGRSRQLFRDDAYFKKFASMVKNNVIGPKGIKLQVQAAKADGSLNTKLNTKVEREFENWGHKETCTVSGKLSWKGAQRLFAKVWARDGEVLVQKVNANNKYGFSLKFWDVSYLDETYNQINAETNNRIIMSVEVDNDHRPVAYHLTTPASEMTLTERQRMQKNRVRVPAEQMIHAFLVEEDETQARGVPLAHAVTIDAKNLDEYDLGVITSAKMTAMSGGFFKKIIPEGEQQFTGVEDDEGNEKPPEVEMSPASFLTLPDNYEFQQFDPKQPTQNHAAFKKTVVMKIACGLDVFYFSLSGDMEAVNFSSARLGLGEEHDMWRSVQDFVITNFCRDVYHAWTRTAFLSGALDLKSSAEFQQIQNPSWRPRGWQYFDPTKEIAANVDGLANNLLTLRDVIEEQGGDFEEHLRKIKSDRDMYLDIVGEPLTYVTKVTATEPGPTDDGTGTKPADKGKAAAAK